MSEKKLRQALAASRAAWAEDPLGYEPENHANLSPREHILEHMDEWESSRPMDEGDRQDEDLHERRALHRNAIRQFAKASGDYTTVPSLKAFYGSLRHHYEGYAELSDKQYNGILSGDHIDLANQHTAMAKGHLKTASKSGPHDKQRDLDLARMHSHAAGLHLAAHLGMAKDTSHGIVADYLEEKHPEYADLAHHLRQASQAG